MKVINLAGGPGSGKSSIAADLFALMKWNNINVELVTEFAKDLTWEQRHATLKDQLYLLAKQNRRLDRLQGQVDYVITDSPLLLVLAYQPIGYHSSFEPFVREVWASYNNINFALNRVKPYHSIGRNQNESEARILDEKIRILFKDDIVHMVNGDKDAKEKIFGIIQDRQLSFNFESPKPLTQIDRLVEYVAKQPGLRIPIIDQSVKTIDHNTLLESERMYTLHADPRYPSA